MIMVAVCTIISEQSRLDNSTEWQTFNLFDEKVKEKENEERNDEPD